MDGTLWSEPQLWKWVFSCHNLLDLLYSLRIFILKVILQHFVIGSKATSWSDQKGFLVSLFLSLWGLGRLGCAITSVKEDSVKSAVMGKCYLPSFRPPSSFPPSLSPFLPFFLHPILPTLLPLEIIIFPLRWQ